jgi:hypothetical protein
MSDPAPAPQNDRHAALFASLVFQWTELGLILLGHAPTEAGQPPEVDLDQAQLVIDQLEMLQAKTRGNLTDPEAALLKRSLTNLRMAFVEAVEKASTPAVAAPAPTPAPAESTPAPAAAQETPPAADPESPPASHDSKVRYSKKY